MKVASDHVQAHPELDASTALQAKGFPVEPRETRVCPSSSGDKAYYIQKVKTATEPNPDDIVAAQTTAWLCSCPAFLYHSGVTENGLSSIEELSACKHISAEVREIKMENDNNQTTL
jgi:hypothetical protein